MGQNIYWSYGHSMQCHLSHVWPYLLAIWKKFRICCNPSVHNKHIWYVSIHEFTIQWCVVERKKGKRKATEWSLLGDVREPTNYFENWQMKRKNKEFTCLSYMNHRVNKWLMKSSSSYKEWGVELEEHHLATLNEIMGEILCAMWWKDIALSVKCIARKLGLNFIKPLNLAINFLWKRRKNILKDTMGMQSVKSQLWKACRTKNPSYSINKTGVCV